MFNRSYSAGVQPKHIPNYNTYPTLFSKSESQLMKEEREDTVAFFKRLDASKEKTYDEILQDLPKQLILQEQEREARNAREARQEWRREEEKKWLAEEEETARTQVKPSVRKVKQGGKRRGTLRKSKNHSKSKGNKRKSASKRRRTIKKRESKKPSRN